jgi:pantetheine-phosphate adenylyltransferase
LVTALYPGSFDPITFGHIDIITRSSRLFEKVYVAVVDTRTSKSLMFSTEERIELCREALSKLPNIEVISYTGLTVDVAHNLGTTVMVRGLRMGSDFDYEFELALNNQQLAPDVDTVYLMASLNHIYMKSSLIKEIAGFHGEIKHLVPTNVAVALRDKYSSRI